MSEQQYAEKLQQAAKQYSSDNNYHTLNIKSELMQAFKSGAEWQSQQPTDLRQKRVNDLSEAIVNSLDGNYILSVHESPEIDKPNFTDTEIEQLWESEIKNAEEHSISLEDRKYFIKGFKAAMDEIHRP